MLAAEVLPPIPAVILAGGQGTRLGSLAAEKPKALVEVGHQPVLFHQLDLLAAAGIQEVWLLIGHLGEQIQQRCGDGAAWGLRIRYLQESRPLGTAGALLALTGKLHSDFLLLSGDIMLHFDLPRLLRWHAQHPESLGTVVIHPSSHFFDSDLVECDSEGRIQHLHTRPHDPARDYHNQSVASVYVLRAAILDQINPDSRSEIEKDLFPRLLQQGQTLYAYSSPEYFKDMGTPERLAKVQSHWQSGWVSRCSLQQARPAVFLDRDGVLNPDSGQICQPRDLVLYPEAALAVQALNAAGWLVILVTNQPLIAKGLLSEAGLDAIHARLETQLGQVGAWLDAIYVCPHHPEAGFAGERPELKIPCHCRKPAPGMLTAACQHFQLTPSDCWMIGDSSTDAAAAQAAGVHFIGVQTGLACADGRVSMAPPHLEKNLRKAVNYLLEQAGSPVAGSWRHSQAPR